MKKILISVALLASGLILGYVGFESYLHDRSATLLTYQVPVPQVPMSQKSPAGPPPSAPAGAEPKASLTVRPTFATEQTWQPQVSVSGQIAPFRSIPVSAQIAGQKAVKVLVELNQVVKKGQLLAQLETEAVQVDSLGAAASLADARQQWETSQRSLSRARTLFKEGFYSSTALEQFESAERSAQARVSIAQAALSSQSVRKNYSTIEAPSDGLVSFKNIEVGQVVGTQGELFRITEGGLLEWHVEVPLYQLARVSIGSKATFNTFSGQTITGAVRLIDPNAQTARALVYVSLADGAQTLPPEISSGAYYKGVIFSPPIQTLTVPQQAILFERSGAQVFVLTNAQGRLLTKNDLPSTRMARVALKPVRLVARQGSAQAIEGIDSQTLIVAEGAGFLNSGDWVRLAAPAPPNSAVKPAPPLEVKAADGSK